jgi:hypothetical protein
MSYILLTSHWCDIIFRNVLDLTYNKIDDMKDSSHEDLARVIYKFPKYHVKILLDFNAIVGRGDIFKPTIRNESLDKICKNTGVRVVKFATSKNLIAESTMFPHHNTDKFTWT